jgi:hypothetical protein
MVRQRDAARTNIAMRILKTLDLHGSVVMSRRVKPGQRLPTSLPTACQKSLLLMAIRLSSSILNVPHLEGKILASPRTRASPNHA